MSDFETLLHCVCNDPNHHDAKALREAIAQEIKEWEASLPDPGARIGPILRIVRGV